jgi:hypothetical protein
MKAIVTNKAIDFKNKYIYAIKNRNKRYKHIYVNTPHDGLIYKEVVPIFQCIEQLKYHLTDKKDIIVQIKKVPSDSYTFLIDSIYSDLDSAEVFYIGYLKKPE